MADLLEFEEPIAVLMKEVEAMSLMPQTAERRRAIAQLEARAVELRGEIYQDAQALAARAGRAPSRPAEHARLRGTPVHGIRGGARRSAVRGR